MNYYTKEAIELQFLIFKVFTILKKKTETVFRKHNLTGAQVGVLSRLSEDAGKPMNKLSEELCCDVSNITGVVDRLEKQGLVLRTQSSEDRRVTLIGITEKGKEALSETMPEHEEVLVNRFAKLSANERTMLLQILRKLDNI